MNFEFRISANFELRLEVNVTFEFELKLSSEMRNIIIKRISDTLVSVLDKIVFVHL